MQTTPSESLVDPPVKLPKYLALREGIFYFKRKVPVSLKWAFEKKEQVWESLNTKDLALATQRLAVEVKRFDEVCEAARRSAPGSIAHVEALKTRKAGATRDLLPEHLPLLVERYAYFLLQTDEEERQELGTLGDEGKTMRNERRRLFEEWSEDVYDAMSVEDVTAFSEVAHDLLNAEKLSAPSQSPLRKRLAAMLLHKDTELFEIQKGRIHGKPFATPAMPPAPRELPTMLEVFEDWSKGQGVEKTIDTYRTFVAEFESLNGELPVICIQKKHVWRYRDWMNDKNLSRRTAKNRIKGLMTLLEAARKALISNLQMNVFDDIDVSMMPDTPSDEARRPFEIRELNLLFKSSAYTSQAFEREGQTSEALYWGPLLGAYCGLRIEEACQMLVSDIKSHDGVWYLRITDEDEEQTLKNANSWRRVPVHRELIQCGFLAYAAEQKQAGEKRLFPSLRNDNKYSKWAPALTKRFGRYLDEIGLDDSRLDFHALRYTLRQQLTLCSVPEEVRDAWTGHWQTKMGGKARTYLKDADGQYPFAALTLACGGFHYSGLDLSHLHVKEPLKNVHLLSR
jgi:integrase